MVTNIKIIDAHCHLHKRIWFKNNLKASFIDFLKENYDEKTILKIMEKGNIKKSIILPFPCIEIDLFTANTYVIELSQSLNNKFIPFVIIDNRPEYWFELGARGFKEHSYGLRTQRDKEKKDGKYIIFCQKFKETYKFLAKQELPLLFHGGPDKIERIKTDILKDVPDLILILAHLGATNPSYPKKEEIKNVLTSFKDYYNIFFYILYISNRELLKLWRKKYGKI